MATRGWAHGGYDAPMNALTQRGKYALKALAHLARRDATAGDRPVLGRAVADAEGIPPKFLEAILADLRKHGVLQARKGRGGGYWLTAAPEEVMVGAVLRIFEGPFAPVACASKRYYAPCDDCTDEADCEVRRVMLDVKLAMLDVLDRTSLADLVARDGEPIRL